MTCYAPNTTTTLPTATYGGNTSTFEMQPTHSSLPPKRKPRSESRISERPTIQVATGAFGSVTPTPKCPQMLSLRPEAAWMDRRHDLTYGRESCRIVVNMIKSLVSVRCGCI